MGGLDSLIFNIRKEVREYSIEIESITGEKLDAKLFVPSGEKNCTGILMNGGMFLDPLRELALLSKIMAKADYVILVPRYIGHKYITTGQMDTEDCVTAFRKLMSCGEVNPENCGIVGFSYGAGLSLLGAAHPSINMDIDFVIAYAAFSELTGLLKYVLTDPRCEKQVRSFAESNLTSQVLYEIRSELGKPENRYKLESGSRDQLVPLFHDLAAIYSVLESPNAENVGHMLSSLSGFSKAMLRELSPAAHIDSLMCRTLLMHGKEDHIVPASQAKRMYRLMKKSGKNVDLILLDGVAHANITNVRGFFHYLLDEHSTIGRKIYSTIKGEE